MKDNPVGGDGENMVEKQAGESKVPRVAPLQSTPPGNAEREC